ncbi:hypothetical protein CIPAW_05G165500 [Carya illinoinensis]|uniref:Transmembrane protein n=1 Tax=Carya illinoinensis TaxID=32201 RepID=A0A8T1QKV2_CARIL|nr:hypothetical protein CIPAW_05G165500 [Carya illinoinensis]
MKLKSIRKMVKEFRERSRGCNACVDDTKRFTILISLIWTEVILSSLSLHGDRLRRNLWNNIPFLVLNNKHKYSGNLVLFPHLILTENYVVFFLLSFVVLCLFIQLGSHEIAKE